MWHRHPHVLVLNMSPMVNFEVDLKLHYFVQYLPDRPIWDQKVKY